MDAILSRNYCAYPNQGLCSIRVFWLGQCFAFRFHFHSRGEPSDVPWSALRAGALMNTIVKSLVCTSASYASHMTRAIQTHTQRLVRWNCNKNIVLLHLRSHTRFQPAEMKSPLRYLEVLCETEQEIPWTSLVRLSPVFTDLTDYVQTLSLIQYKTHFGYFYARTLSDKPWLFLPTSNRRAFAISSGRIVGRGMNKATEALYLSPYLPTRISLHIHRDVLMNTTWVLRYVYRFPIEVVHIRVDWDTTNPKPPVALLELLCWTSDSFCRILL